MRKFSNKDGFTLIEIIVVLIIVGILAAIAIPNIFGNITKSRAAEALTTIDSIRATIETCISQNAGVETTCTFAGMFPATSQPASPNFTYTLGGIQAGSTGYNVLASGNNAAAGGTLTIARTAAADGAAFGAMTCAGTGNLLGVC